MKKRTALVILMIAAFANYSFAADIVHLKDGTKYEGKVLAIHPDRLEMSTGEGMPARIIAIEDVALIVYDNGQTESFQDTVKALDKQKELQARLAASEKENTEATGLLWMATGCVVIVTLVLIGVYRGLKSLD